MVQVLPGMPTFAQNLFQQLNQTGSQVGQALAQRRSGQLDEQIINSFNPEEPPLLQIQKFAKLSKGAQEGLSPLFTQYLKSQQDQVSNSAKRSQEDAPIKSALELVERQRELLQGGHLGPKLGDVGQSPKLLHTLTKEGQKARKEYERIGKSLIGYASSVPIRNKAEFEALAEGLYDPTLTEAEIEGTIDAMQKILQGKISQSEDGEERFIEKAGKELTDDIIDSLLNESKNDINKARAKAKKLGYKF